MDSEVTYLLRQPRSTRLTKQPNRRWPIIFWIILKLLAVFYHQDILIKRQCFKCKVKDSTFFKQSGDNRSIQRKGIFGASLALAYEGHSMIRKDQDKVDCVPLESDSDEICELCETEWWNYSGEIFKYTAKEIGGTAWNHQGSGVISICMNLCCIGVIVYDVGDYFSIKWGKSDQTLHLLKNISFYAFAISYPLISLCSKLRSVLVENAPFLSWTSTLNARYLIKRAQYLGLSEKGLPGKLFLFLCSVLPLLVTFYRAFIYLYISKCPFTSQEIVRIVRDVYFLETLGCFVYIIYLIRISFQHQFSLLLSYIKEEEGHLDKCRGALFNVTTDFTCFKQFCSSYLLCTIPMAVLAFSSSIAWQYTVISTCRSSSNETVLHVENNICRYVWLVFLLYLAVLTYAIGGLSIEYIWDNFYDDVLQLQSESHGKFWDSFVHQLSLLYKTKDNLTVTLFFSVLSCFTALQLGDQDVTFLDNACNGTFVNMTSHYCF